jgi:glycosyltransferase A (GT-A) superfamily protein (DUF2064 family)
MVSVLALWSRVDSRWLAIACRRPEPGKEKARVVVAVGVERRAELELAAVMSLTSNERADGDRHAVVGQRAGTRQGRDP